MKHAISRRQLIKTAALGGAGALLAACGAPSTPQIIEVTRQTVKEVQSTVQVTTEVTQQVEVTKEVQVTAAPTAATKLTVWGSGLDLTQIDKDPTGAGAAMKMHRDLFIAKHPGTTVVWEDHGWDETLRENVTTALLGGTAPDVIVGENFFQAYAALNAMLPIDDVIPPDVAKNSIVGTHKAAIYNGKIYGLSWLSGCFGFEMNGDLLKAAGLDQKVPGTWDEMLAVSKAVTDKGAGKFFGYTLQGPQGFSVGGMFRLAVYLQQLGVTINKPDAFDQPNFNDPKGFPVWDLVRKLNPYEPPGLVFESDEGKVYTQLFLGKSAQQVAGSWFVSWATANKFNNSVWGSVPIPQGGKAASYVVGNVIYGVLSASKAPDLAKDWVIISQNDKVQNLVFSSAGRLPSTISAMNTLVADTATGAGHPTDADKTFGKLLRDSDLGILPQWTKAPNQLNQIWNDLFTAVIQSKTDIKQLADDAQTKAEAAMKA